MIYSPLKSNKSISYCKQFPIKGHMSWFSCYNVKWIILPSGHKSILLHQQTFSKDRYVIKNMIKQKSICISQTSFSSHYQPITYLGPLREGTIKVQMTLIIITVDRMSMKPLIYLSVIVDIGLFYAHSILTGGNDFSWPDQYANKYL